MDALRVLVVDDDQDMADSLGMLLELEGYVVRTTYDGAAALDVVDDFHPHVALLDIVLPDISGHDVGRQLRTRPGCEDTLLIALTGWGKQEDFQRSRAAGFTYHLVKPVDPNDLIELLASLFRADD